MAEATFLFESLLGRCAEQVGVQAFSGQLVVGLRLGERGALGGDGLGRVFLHHIPRDVAVGQSLGGFRVEEVAVAVGLLRLLRFEARLWEHEKSVKAQPGECGHASITVGCRLADGKGVIIDHGSG